ncbi:hypothetical protein [Lentibacillus amyloliquefaciens]|uniref:Ribosomal protein L7/L12 C-terminal domain-containing protein n=1 Tax=Lentibacillus amyloliquefaciens TaxID=1472767 RepID=A0A0U4E5X7_9BACI|nr:hypothetical protein [Lentibacillus amyloliquefaciens]ALX48273.1 hypothetical protein AOX59_06430 [Lentibacillus amyloliquefaciens]
MPWSDISSLLIIIALVCWCFSLMRENSILKRENARLLENTGTYEDIKNEAKEILKTSTEVKTVKSLREKYGLSLINAKKIVDSVR